MLTQDFINDVLLEIPAFEATQNNIQNKSFSVPGYDAAITLCENGRSAQYPIAILEERGSGVFSAEYGGIDSFSQSIWVMSEISERERIDKYTASRRSFDLLKKIIAKLISSKEEGVLPGLDVSSFPYFERNTAVAAGYEFVVNFNNDINLSGDGD